MLPWIFSRKGASGFSWASTADQVTDGISAAGLVAIVTGTPPSSLSPIQIDSIRFGSLNLILLAPAGASSGIGAETARVLAARGAGTSARRSR